MNATILECSHGHLARQCARCTAIAEAEELRGFLSVTIDQMRLIGDSYHHYPDIHRTFRAFAKDLETARGMAVEIKAAL